MATRTKETPQTQGTNLTGEQLHDIEQVGFGQQGQQEAVPPGDEEHEGIAVIDIASGRTLREERLPEPKSTNRPGR